MNKIIVLLLISIFSSIGFVNANSNDARRNQIIQIIDEELREVTRLNKQTRSRNPQLMLRMAELLLEKARHIKEGENFKYLTLNPDKRRKKSKSSYFKKSNGYFKQAQKTGYFILKRFPRFNQKADVYYILGYNAKEFNKPKTATKLLERANRYSKRGTASSNKIKIALAEIYYNNKDYRKARPLYEQALAKKTEKWWTKDAYNLAWSYYRLNYKTKAIAKMKEVYKYSKDPNFIDLSKDVERDLGFFYSTGGKTKEAVGFYQGIGQDVGANFTKMGKYLKEQGKFTQAEQLFVKAKTHAKTNQEKAEINIELLSLYERFGKTSKHLSVTRDLVGAYKQGQILTSAQFDIVKYHIKKQAVTLQKQVSGKTYQSQNKILNAKGRMAAEYFTLQASINEKTSHRALFHAAESNFASKRYNNAITLYDSAYKGAIAKRDRKFAARSLEGILAALGKKGVRKDIVDTHLVKSYELYLKAGASKQKSFTIYQRLFQEYFKKDDIPKAQGTLDRFAKAFPKSIDKQEAMIGKLVDYHKAHNDWKSLKALEQSISAKKYSVAPSYAGKLKNILLAMQFASVQAASKKGDKKGALRLYLDIYKRKDTTAEAKKNAAYNIAVLFHELDDGRRSYLWMKQALGLMGTSDVEKFSSSFLLMSGGLFSQRKFKEAAEIYEKTFTKLCSTSDRNKTAFFKNAYVMKLANKDVKAAEQTIKSAYRCGLKSNVMSDAEMELVNELIKTKRWRSLSTKVAALEASQSRWPNLIYPASILEKEYRKVGSTATANTHIKKIEKYFQYAKRNNKNIPLEGLDEYASFKIRDIERLRNSLTQAPLRFPENTYNSILKNKFALLDQVTTKSLELLSLGSGEGVVESYATLVRTYEGLAGEINSFVPPGKSPDYIKSFQGSMRQISAPLTQKANEFRNEARKQVIRNKILARNNYLFFTNQDLGVEVEFHAKREGILMDKGGGQ